MTEAKPTQGFSKVWSYTFYPKPQDTTTWKHYVNWKIKNQNELRRAVYQHEICPETGRWHLQGYVRWKRGCRLPQCKVWIGLGDDIHLEASGGTDSDNYDYCTKLDTRADHNKLHMLGIYVDLGTPFDPTIEGDWLTSGEKRRGVYESNAKVLKEQGVKALYQLDPGFCLNNPTKIMKFEENFVRRFTTDDVVRKVRIIYCEGATGIGKTSACYRAFCNRMYNLVPHSSRSTEDPWWDAYEGEDTVLIDEIKPGMLETTMLNRWADGYPCRLRTKGGHTWANYTLLIMLSNYSLNECIFDPHGAFARRITKHVRLTNAPNEFNFNWLMDILSTPDFSGVAVANSEQQRYLTSLSDRNKQSLYSDDLHNLINRPLVSRVEDFDKTINNYVTGSLSAPDPHPMHDEYD